MSRHTKTKKFVEEQMQHMENDNSDEYIEEEDDFNEEEWQIIQNLSNMMQVSRQIAINALKDTDGDFDKAVIAIQRQQKKQKDKKQKKQKEDKEKQKKVQQNKNNNGQLALKSKKSQDLQNIRKSSSEDWHVPRKNSYIVEDYDKDHYNTQYPPIQTDKNILPSKTINIVVVGHVDSGKSTLVGMLLHQIKALPKKQMHKNQQISKQLGKQSFKYAYVTDQTQQQRTRGVTIDVGVKKIEIDDKKIVFLDSPGHKQFVPNMITGAAQADYAILVIDVTHFEASFINGGQTKQHAYIVKSLGVHKLIIAMNKMDLIKWNPQSFDIIKKKLNFYLFRIGFKQQSIVYVPVSAFYGLNIAKNLENKFQSKETIYSKSLLETISELPLPIRLVDKPLRMNITNFYDSPQGKMKGHCISGKIQGGVLKKDDKLVILPQNCQCLIKDIMINEQKVKQAIVGDNVDVQIKLIDETYFQTIKYGNVLSSLKYSIPVSNKFVVEALAMDLDDPILKGTQIILYIGANKTPARISKINYIFDPINGTIIKKNPRSIKSNDCAEIQIETQKRVCVQIFANFKIFGRVIIRQKNQTLCVGTVKLIK